MASLLSRLSLACLAVALGPSAFAQTTVTYTNGETNNTSYNSTGNDLTLTVDDSDSAAQSGILSGSGTVEKTGTGDLSLSGTNTFTGTTTVSAGTLSIDADAGLGTAPGSATTGHLTLDGGTLATTSSFTLNANRGITLGSSGGTLAPADATSLTYGGIIAGDGALTKSGAGNLIFSGANTYTGGTTISAGTLTFNPGGSVAGDITNNGSVVFNRSDDYAYLGVVSGSGGLTHDGYILRFDKAQTYTGPTAVKSGGSLVLTTHADQGLSAATTVDVESGAIFDLSNRVLTIAGLTGAGRVYSFNASAGHLTLNIADGQTSNFSGVLGGVSYMNFALTKTGAGTQILSGDNNYTGTTTISGGTLQIGDGATTGTLGSAAVVNNAALAFNRSSSLTVTNAISGSGSVTQLGAGSLTLSGANTYTGNTTVSAGTLHFNAPASLYSGTIDSTNAAKISVANGATLSLGVGTGSSFSSSNISTVATNATFDAGAKLALNTASATGGIANLSDLSTGAANLQKTGTGTLYITGTSTGTGTMGVETGTLTYESTGAFLGGTVNTTNAAKISVADGATLSLGVGGTSSFTNSNITTVSQNATFASGSRFGLDTTGATGGTATINDLNFGSTGFTKTGTGSLTLTGTTTLTGSTTLAGGSLIIGSDALLGAAPGTATAGHLTLDGGTLNTTASLSIDTNRGIALESGGGSITVDDSTTLTIAGEIAGTGNLTKTGTGTLALTNGSGGTGNITVSAGALQIGDGGAASLSTSNITNNSTLAFDSTDDLTLSGTIDGTGNLTKAGSGSLTVGSLTSSGSITVTAGNLTTSSDIADRVATISGNTASLTDTGVFNDVGNTGTGSLSITDGGSYNLSSTSSLNYLIIGSQAGSNGTVTVSGDGSNITSGGRLRPGSSGTGVLNIEDGATASFSRASDSFVGNSSTGNGTVTLSGTGSSLTLGGRFVVGNAGTGTVTVGNGTTVTADRLQLAQDIGSTGTLNLNSGGTLIVSDANGTALESGAGAATFNFAGGTLKSNGANALTVSSNATLADGTTSTIDTNGQASTWSGVLSGAGNLAKAGTGTLTLSGINTHTGATIISAGTLALGESGTIANSSGLNLGTSGTLDVTAKSSFGFGSGQTVSGMGTLDLGTGKDATIAGTLSPGNSPGILNVTGNLILNSTTITNLELASNGGTAGTHFDQVNVTGNLTLGGTLNLIAFAGYTPAVNDSFQVFTATSIGGTFAQINLSGFGSGVTFNTSQLANTGVITVSAVPEPGSFALLAGLLTLGFVGTRRRRN